VPVTKAQEVYDKVEALVASGMEKAEAFKQLARETGRPYDSLRGSYYSHKTKIEGGESRPRTRRRETTPEDALADARASLERSIAAIDREVEVAEERAAESTAEAKALKASAAERKKAITERLGDPGETTCESPVRRTRDAFPQSIHQSCGSLRIPGRPRL
jgi:hypothetical protein